MPNDELKKLIKPEITNLGGCERKAKYNITPDIMKAEAGSVLKELCKYAEIPGFRKGKAPAELIKNRFKGRIQEELVRRIAVTAAESLFDDKENEVCAMDYPKDLESKFANSSEPVVFEIGYEVMPNFQTPEYKGIKIDAKDVDVSDDEVAKKIQEYKNVYADYKAVEAKAEKGDMLKVSYTSDFTLPEDASPSLARMVKSDENWIWLSEPEVIPGAIKALEGAAKGEERKLDAEFTAGFREPALAGKKVSYNVSVKEVQRKSPVDSDEELFKRMRLDSVDALKDMVKKAISRQKSAAKKNENAAAVYNMISAKVGEIPLPRSLTMKEAEREMRAMLREKVKSEEDLKGFKENQAAILEEAKKTAEQRVRKYIILRKIAKQENITVEGSEMSAQLRQMSKYFGAKEKDLRHAMSQNGGMDELHADMLCGKVLDFLLEKADTGAKQ